MAVNLQEDRDIKMIKVTFRDPSFRTNNGVTVYYLAAVMPKKLHEILDDFVQMCGFETIRSYISYLWPIAQNIEYDEYARSKCLFKSDTTEMTIEFQDILFGKGDCPYLMLSDTTTTPVMILDNDLINKVCRKLSPYTEGVHYTPNEIFGGTWNSGCQSTKSNLIFIGFMDWKKSKSRR